MLSCTAAAGLPLESARFGALGWARLRGFSGACPRLGPASGLGAPDAYSVWVLGRAVVWFKDLTQGLQSNLLIKVVKVKVEY